MTDKDLCRRVAEIWVMEGGDELGFEMCYSLIKKWIAEVIHDKELIANS